MWLSNYMKKKFNRIYQGTNKIIYVSLECTASLCFLLGFKSNGSKVDFKKMSDIFLFDRKIKEMCIFMNSFLHNMIRHIVDFC